MMPTIDCNLKNTAIIHQLVQKSCGINYKITSLPSDASKRCYHRITTLEGSLMLMDASLDRHSIEPFIKVAKILKDNNLLAPSIIAHDLKNGFLILEDFGNVSVNDIIQKDLSFEEHLYKKSILILSHLNKIRITKDIDFPQYSPELLNKELDTFTEWYLQDIVKQDTIKQACTELKAIFNKLYKTVFSLPQVIVLRDYHVDNLMYLASTDEIGLLDFQDAVVGSPAYDLASLLKDARRSINKNFADKMFDLYAQNNNQYNRQLLYDSYLILSMQRNLKIIGIFHRLNKRDNNSKYLKYLPTVWQYIYQDLETSQLKDIKNWFCKYDCFDQ